MMTATHKVLLGGIAGLLMLGAGLEASAEDSIATAPTIYALNTEGATPVTFDELLDELSDYDVVFLGEEHGEAQIHAMQLAILSGLYERSCDVALSMEQFERDVQPLLDRYLAGSSSEADFLAAARPWPNYHEDYRPLVEFAREHGLAVAASNIPRPLASRVFKEGFEATFFALSEEERGWAATDFYFDQDGYYDNFMTLMGAMAADHGGGMDEASLWPMFQAQAVKDDTMAESIAALRRNSCALVVHTNGNFHSDYSLGTVSRYALRRPVDRVAVVTMRTTASLDSALATPHGYRPVADYLIVVDAEPAAEPVAGR